MQLSTELLTLCDFALTSKEGKLSLIGIFDRFFVSQLPSKYSRFFLVAIVTGKPNSTHQITLQLKTPTKAELLPIKSINISFGANGKANLITDLANITFPEVGEYQIALTADSKTIGDKSFFVTKVTNQQTDQPNQLPN